MSWIKKYGITNDEIKQNNVLWSEEKRQLIFPIYGGDGELLSWQARNFAPQTKKYFTNGRIEECLVFVPSTVLPSGDWCCLVEDMVSCIKVGRHTTASPLFGSTISINRLNRLRRLFSGLYIWLDRDKAKEAYKAALKAKQMGFDTQVIVTDLDPKELGDKDIKEMLNG